MVTTDYYSLFLKRLKHVGVRKTGEKRYLKENSFRVRLSLNMASVISFSSLKH